MPFQIQEMIRAERLVADRRIQDEIDVYNELVPGPGELSATMMIEIEAQARVEAELTRFRGVDSGQQVWLEIADEPAVPASFEPGRSTPERISAVHFVRFPLPVAARRALGRGPAAIVVDHPRYRARTQLAEATRRARLEDLGEPWTGP